MNDQKGCVHTRRIRTRKLETGIPLNRSNQEKNEVRHFAMKRAKVQRKWVNKKHVNRFLGPNLTEYDDFEVF